MTYEQSANKYLDSAAHRLDRAQHSQESDAPSVIAQMATAQAILALNSTVYELLQELKRLNDEMAAARTAK